MNYTQTVMGDDKGEIMHTFIVRLFQLIIALFFTFTVFLWFGGALLALLALWVKLTSAMAGDQAGLASLFYAFLSAALLVGAVYGVSRIPQVGATFWAIGVQLTKLALANLQHLDTSLLSPSGSAPTHAKIPEAGAAAKDDAA